MSLVCSIHKQEVSVNNKKYSKDDYDEKLKKAIDKPATCSDDEWIVREIKERVMKLREEPNVAPKYVPNPAAE